MSNSTGSGGTVALAGAAGSHPSTIRLVAQALRDLTAETPRLVLDLSRFDRRGEADYGGIDATVLRLEPRAFGMPTVFATSGPNLMLSGGTRRYRAMVAAFDRLLAEHGVSRLLMSHALGFPEQALIEAAAARGVRVAQIDEGPFSISVRPKEQPEFNPGWKGRMLALAKALGLIPKRELTGRYVDRFFATSRGRGRALLDRGLDPTKLVVLPCPRFDALAELSRSWIDRDRAVVARVLFFHQPFRLDRKVRTEEADRAEIVLAEGLARAARQRPIAVSVRMHPRSREQERLRIERRFAAAGVECTFSTGRPLAEDMMGNDLFVGFYSSALLEAAACGAPTTAVRLAPEHFGVASEAEKAVAIGTLGTPVADTADALAAIVLDGLARGTVPPPATLLDEHIGDLNGDGAEKVARALLAM